MLLLSFIFVLCAANSVVLGYLLYKSDHKRVIPPDEALANCFMDLNESGFTVARIDSAKILYRSPRS